MEHVQDMHTIVLEFPNIMNYIVHINIWWRVLCILQSEDVFCGYIMQKLIEALQSKEQKKKTDLGANETMKALNDDDEDDDNDDDGGGDDDDGDDGDDDEDDDNYKRNLPLLRSAMATND